MQIHRDVHNHAGRDNVYHVNKAVVYGWNLTLWTTTSQMSGDSSQGVIGEGGR